MKRSSFIRTMVGLPVVAVAAPLFPDGLFGNGAMMPTKKALAWKNMKDRLLAGQLVAIAKRIVGNVGDPGLTAYSVTGQPFIKAAYGFPASAEGSVELLKAWESEIRAYLQSVNAIPIPLYYSQEPTLYWRALPVVTDCELRPGHKQFWARFLISRYVPNHLLDDADLRELHTNAMKRATMRVFN